MSDDLLQRAARALRDEADGRGAPPLPTGAILDQIEAERRNRARRMAIVAPLAAVLVTSTAIAAATGALPGAWQKVKALVAAPPPVVSAEAPESAAPPQGNPASARGKRPAPDVAEPLAQQRQIAAEPAALAVEPAPSARPGPAASPPDPAPSTGPAKPRGLPKPSRSEENLPAEPSAAPPAPAPAAQPAPAEPPPVEPPPAEPPPAQAPPADGLDLFRRAQQLQFKQRQWQAALDAWDAYLAGQARGALAPEARWNRAVCLLRLHRTAEARRALQPFAQGAEGGYRQAEAQALLRALDEGAEP